MMERLDIKGQEYDIEPFLKEDIDVDAVSIIIVSHQSPDMTINAVKSFQKFSTVPIEIFVVDNRSTEDVVDRLKTLDDVNLILNRGPHISSIDGTAHDSAQNAVGIHIGAHFVRSRYMFVCHNDVLAFRHGWLNQLLVSMNKHDETGKVIKGVGFGFDPHPDRIKALHVSGYLLDWEYYRKNATVDWFPRYEDSMMRLDVGDHFTEFVRQQAHAVLSLPNTHNQPELIDWVDNNPNNALVKKHGVFADKSIDEEGNILFMHLGRGIQKFGGKYHKPGRTDYETWVRFGKEVVDG